MSTSTSKKSTNKTTVSEMQQGQSTTATWRLKNWSRCHRFLTTRCDCSLQVGHASLRFFLRPLEKTFENGNRGDTIIVTIQYYSLWVEVVNCGEESELFLNVHTKVTPSYSERYNPGKPDSQVAVTNLSAKCDANREILVQERFIYMGSFTTNLANRNFGVELLYDGATEVSIDITATLFHFIDDKKTVTRSGTGIHNNIADETSEEELLSNQLSKLLEEDDNSNLHDVQLKMKDDVVLPAHRAILSARSPVFRAMFSSSMKETFSDVVVIPDIASDAMRVVLKYIYTGLIDDSWGEYVEEVVHAANKYILTKLLDHCDNKMITICTFSNAVELFRLAKLHSLQNAMRLLTEFTKANTANVLLSTGTE